MATRRSSKRRVSQSMTVTDAPFIVDFYDGGMKSVDAASRAEALRVAKAHGRHDRPSVVWKLSPGKSKKRYRPHCVVVEGKILK